MRSHPLRIHRYIEFFKLRAVGVQTLLREYDGTSFQALFRTPYVTHPPPDYVMSSGCNGSLPFNSAHQPATYRLQQNNKLRRAHQRMAMSYKFSLSKPAALLLPFFTPVDKVPGDSHKYGLLIRVHLKISNCFIHGIGRLLNSTKMKSSQC